MKRYTLLSLILFFGLAPWRAVASTTATNDRISLQELDALLQRSQEVVMNKEMHIKRLRAKLPPAASLEQRYEQNALLYQHYMVYDSDSAMNLMNRNLQIAERLGRTDWQADCLIEKSFIYTATGMLKEAEDELRKIDTRRLSYESRLNYYGQKVYLLSHCSQYHGHLDNALGNEYFLQEMAYRDSIDCLIRPEHPLYLWYKGWMSFYAENDLTDILRQLREVVDTSPLNNRLDAMNAYVLARLCEKSRRWDEYVHYLTLSAMADARICNRDIASLYELGHYLCGQGDIDHAYSYIHYCLQQAQLYRNRVRLLDITQTMNDLHQRYLDRINRQQQRLKLYLVIISLSALVLLLSLFFIMRLLNKLNKKRTQLAETNHKLSGHVREITLTRERLTEAHAQLQEQNRQLEQTVRQLKELRLEQEQTLEQLQESNYVKEEYIGYVFTMCSNYIDKLNEYRKGVNRKIKAGQLAELKQQTDTPTSVQMELKEFYHTFDTIFLNVYPNFVSDFNALLRPDEQIVLREGELLNTDLRIYALVRLGINDSTKIASFLHCSPQTVYNNRLKIRNKAVIAKESFAQVVGSLGKYGQNG